jgi:UDP-perosamine 4-acetyltransferase
LKAVIVFGAGGHAKVVIDILQTTNVPVAFCVASSSDISSCMGVRVLHGDHRAAELWKEGFRRAFIAIGDNRIRERVGLQMLGMGYEMVNALSPSAHISSSVALGLGVAVMPGAVINAESRLDSFAIINTSATVDHDCRIGTAAHVGPNCSLAGNVTVGARAFLGIGSTVIPGITIGTDALIGAGSVVITNITDGAKALGVPARVRTDSAAKR